MLNYLDIFSHRCRTTVSLETYPLYSKWRKASSLNIASSPPAPGIKTYHVFREIFAVKPIWGPAGCILDGIKVNQLGEKTLDSNSFVKRGYSVLGLFLMLRTQADTPKSECILWTNDLRSVASEVLAYNYFCPVLGLQVIISILAIFLKAYMGVTLPDGKITLRLFLWVV